MAPSHAGLMPTAYKEKMKELSVLSLICSCFYSQPHPNTIYQYGGECALGCCPLLLGQCLPPPFLALCSHGFSNPPCPHLSSAGFWRGSL